MSDRQPPAPPVTGTGSTAASGDDARQWPRAKLDAIARLRVVETALPGAVGVEGLVQAPFEQVWAWISDLERSVPTFDHAVSKLSIRTRRGSALDLLAWTPGMPVPMPFTAHLEPGLCLMRAKARLYLVGMAAVPEGDRTRFRHVEGVPLPVVGRAVRPVVRREVAADLRGIVGHFERSP